nr:hypothetical protein Itr_chr07CG11880 [Ipomoea trifida]
MLSGLGPSTWSAKRLGTVHVERDDSYLSNVKNALRIVRAIKVGNTILLWICLE